MPGRQAVTLLNIGVGEPALHEFASRCGAAFVAHSSRRQRPEADIKCKGTLECIEVALFERLNERFDR